jgi:predicted RNA-binding protein
MATPSGDVPFGFLLVTADPALVSGRTGSAWDLVRARLEARLWPIYRSTRSRAAIQNPGARLAFYVGGQSENAGLVAATALVQKVVPAGRSPRLVDPQIYLTDIPFLVLALRDVLLIDRPVKFRDVLPKLSMKAPTRGSWGILLQGGARALNEEDWRLLVPRRP